MRSARLLGVLVLGLALASACNDNNVAGTTSPTPTGTSSPTPTGTSANSTWDLSPSPTSQNCTGGFPEDFIVSSVDIDLTSGNFIPNWGLVTDPQVGSAAIVTAPQGTVTGNDFTSTWDYCRYDGISALTFRRAWTWTGTFANGGTTFTSVLHEVVSYGSGDVRSTCATAANTNYGNCTSPGIDWNISATKQ